MRISVRSRAGRNGKEPRSFCLGGCELHVMDIIERCEITGAYRFQVRVSDGRRFVIRHQPATDRWELAAVYGRGRAPLPPSAVRR